MGVARYGVNEATVQTVNNRNSASREAPAVLMVILDSPIKQHLQAKASRAEEGGPNQIGDRERERTEKMSPVSVSENVKIQTTNDSQDLQPKWII